MRIYKKAFHLIVIRDLQNTIFCTLSACLCKARHKHRDDAISRKEKRRNGRYFFIHTSGTTLMSVNKNSLTECRLCNTKGFEVAQN